MWAPYMEQWSLSMPQTNTPLDSRIVANAVLDRARAIRRPITNLDMQKIVYFMHGHHLVRHGNPLVRGEFEAWPYQRRVHRVLYNAFREYDNKPIDKLAMAFDPITAASHLCSVPWDAAPLAVLDEFLGYYLDLSTYLLVELTHGDGTPWSRTMEDARDRINVGMKISDGTICSFFEGIPSRDELASSGSKRQLTNGATPRKAQKNCRAEG